MPAPSRKNGAHDAVIERALEVGLKKSEEEAQAVEAELPLTARQEKMLMELCNVFGLSTRSVLNASLRYALHEARARKVAVHKLKEFPRRLDGHRVPFQLTAETLAQVREANVLDRLAACVVTGLRLFHARTLQNPSTR